MIFLLIFLTILLIYTGILIFLNDLSIPTLNKRDFKNKSVLFIFPHPDDESFCSGGLLRAMSMDRSNKVFVVSLTAGEHGNEKYKISPADLAEVRRGEFLKAISHLGAENSQIWDFPDGGLPGHESEIADKIQNFIFEHKINLVVTYEKCGVYGHPDHKSLSKIVSGLAAKLGFETLYATLPPKILNVVNLPQVLTYSDHQEKLAREKITAPQYKFGIFSHIMHKYLAIKEYKSQNLSHGIPLFLLLIFGVYEYYTREYPQ
jgi:N-acetylglucosamine malate deacetylase 2